MNIKNIINFIMGNSFQKRIENSLNIFTKAKNDLMEINIEINSEVRLNNSKVAEIERRNSELDNMKSKNNEVIDRIGSLIS
jgi:hypothetical protein